MNAKDTDTPIVLSSVLESCNKERCICYAPTHRGALYRFNHNETFQLSYVAGGVTIVFDAKFLRKMRKGGLNFIEAERIGDIRRIQNRQDFRLSIAMSIKIAYPQKIKTVTGEGDDAVVQVEYGPMLFEFVMTTDLSGGGVSFTTNTEFEKDDKVTVFMKLNNDVDEVFQSVVMRVTTLDDTTARFKYTVGCRFELDKPQDKERLVHFCFEKQREAAGKHRDIGTRT